MKNTRIVFILIILVLSVSFLSATIINIPEDYNQIQIGINVSTDGDTILVQPGTYYENINFNGHNITVCSLFLTTQDSFYIEQTIIDGSQEGRVVTFETNENSTASLTGFTLKNGNVYGPTYPENRGGGISIDSSSPTLTNLIVASNQAVAAGGISFWDNANATLDHVIVEDNYSYDNSGGIHISNSYPTISNSIIKNNFASSKSGGIGFSSSSPTLTNTLIVNNTAGDKGGAMYLSSEAWPIMVNVTICNNSSAWSAIHCDTGSRPNLINCILWNNSPDEILFDNGDAIVISYSNVRNGWGGTGNINEYPLFTGTGNNQYSLQEASPCVDAGIPNTSGLMLPPWDLIGNLRIWDGDGNGIANIDMGAYEYGSLPYVDVNYNAIIQPPDFSLFQNYPNPFNPSTTISFNISSELNDNAVVSIFNLKGQLIKTYSINSGQTSITWNGEDEFEKTVTSGIYLYKLNVGNKFFTKKMILLK
jgi:hypothetical protein